jgi:glutamyl/glutaminyl-tRNA synthetase
LLSKQLVPYTTKGKFILRVEDTDTARSTRESEEAMLRDLKWMGRVGTFHSRYFAVRTPVDDTQYGPHNQPDTPRE